MSEEGQDAGWRLERELVRLRMRLRALRDTALLAHDDYHHTDSFRFCSHLVCREYRDEWE